MAEASRLPISNQQAAIRTLDGFSDGAIQGFFTYAYSIELLKSGGKVQNDRLSLSWEQLAAIKFLKDCPFELIQSWRSRPLQPDHGSLDQSKPRLYGSVPQYSSGDDSRPSHRFAMAGGNNISKALAYTKSSSAGLLTRHSSFNGSVLNDVNQSGNMSPSVQATCFCTYCARPFRTKDGWSRHENEDHESHCFPCIPNGSVEIRGSGPECSICKTPNPDESHINMHQLAPCLSKPLSGREFKRRGDLVSHLRSHGVTDGSGLGLAEQWKRTSDRKAWACGFCVRIFFQRMDRINHIYNQHWSNGATISSWNPSLVIQGLLLQPLLSSRWLESLSNDTMFDSSKITWHSSVIKDLQRRLELAEEHPENLVAAAYEQSSLGTYPSDQFGVEINNHESMTREQSTSCLISSEMQNQILKPPASQPSQPSICQVNPYLDHLISELPFMNPGPEIDWIWTGDPCASWCERPSEQGPLIWQHPL